MTNSKSNTAAKAEPTRSNVGTSMEVLLKNVADPESFKAHPEVLALAFYCRARYGITPYQKDASWKPLMRFKQRVGDKEIGEISITVFYPNGKDYPYTRFAVALRRNNGVTQKYMPLTLDQTIRLVQDFQDPYSPHSRITDAETERADSDDVPA